MYLFIVLYGAFYHILDIAILSLSIVCVVHILLLRFQCISEEKLCFKHCLKQTVQLLNLESYLKSAPGADY